MRYLIFCVVLAVSCKTPGLPVVHQEGGNRQFIEEKLQRGIDFYAVGHEPEWSLERGKDIGLVFQSLDGDTVKVPGHALVKKRKQGYTSYRFQKGNLDYAFSLYPEACIDNMSGEGFPIRVIITSISRPDSSKREWRGCGRRIR